MRTMGYLFLLLLLILLLAGLATVAYAAYPVQAGDSTIAPLLEQLLVPGVLGAVVGVLLSYLVELWPAYDALDPKWKRLLFFGFSLVVGVLAGIGIAYFRGQAFNWDAIVGNAIVAALAAASGGTLAHTARLQRR